MIQAAPSTSDALLAGISSRYDVQRLDVHAGQEAFRILVVRDTNRLLDQITPDRFAEDERLPYWAELWTSSLDLACWLQQQPGIAGKKVLELGCGVGLAGIAAARTGATVTMSDYEPDALLFARYNAMVNLSASAFNDRARFLLMDWRSPGIDGRFDLIVGADIVYERRNFAPVLALLRSCLAPGGSALLTEPDRSVGRSFAEEARAYPLSLEHSFSEVVRDGKSFRISRMLLRHEPFQTS